MSRRKGRILGALACALVIGVGGCGESESAQPTAGVSFDELVQEASGQTLRWWMFGGDQRINDYVDDVVAPAVRDAGFELERVPVTDTAEAVQRVVSQRRAGETSGGAVDLIWINGENFAAGKENGLWLEGWVENLPNAANVDLDDPSIALDMQVPTEGQEAPWSRAAFVFASDPDDVPASPRTFDELLDYARENPGRVTYPAPPDFTGTSFVKQVVIAKGEDEAFDYLTELRPLMWEDGEKFPKSEAELNQLFADGEVDFAMSFDPAFIETAVRMGQFPETTRPFLLEGGALVNTSYVTIPADAENVEGAQVLANILLDPELQAIKADPEVLGVPTVLDLERLEPEERKAFDSATGSVYLLDDFGDTKDELAADGVPPLEERWKREILP